MNRILNFHVVSDPCWFEEIVLFLKSKYKMVTVTELNEHFSNKVNGTEFCHLTVDDGDISFYTHIYPVLKKHRVPASLFVSPKICEEEENFWYQEIIGYNEMKFKEIISGILNIAVSVIIRHNIEDILKALPISLIQKIITTYQKTTATPKKPFQNVSVGKIKEIHNSGLITIGGHTMNHPILKNESDESSKYEISASIQRLSALLNTEIRYFAYPNGIPGLDFTEREMQHLDTIGTHLSFSTEAKSFTFKEDSMAIPRIGVTDKENIAFLKMKLLAGSSWVNIKKLKMKTETSERKVLIKKFQHLNCH
jgi:peptidoglycan/xylan/chitin deacetylase (PgdA/CDA1 family)